MNQGYFHCVASQTGTRLWINNPTPEECRWALEAGAIACTTNPGYASRMLKLPETHNLVLMLADQAIRRHESDADAAAEVQRNLIARIAVEFMPHFKATNGTEGFVSIQMNPNDETNAVRIVQEALADFALIPNCIAKIPVIPSGLKAIDCLVRLNKPVIATEIMSISQALKVCEIYQRASKESGHTPPLFVTHISGIFDDQLRDEAEAMGVALSKEALYYAGVAIAKKQYRILKERGLPVIQLGGGARGLHHFTELVGGKLDVTMNWPGSVQVLYENPPEIVNRLDIPVPQHVIDELIRTMPIFAQAYAEGGLQPEEFEDYSPVVRFRNQFLKGWSELTALIAERRSAQSPRKVFRLGDRTSVEMRPGIFRSTLVWDGDQMLCLFAENSGARVDLHTHKAVQSGIVLSGTVRFFDADGNSQDLKAGDAYLFSSNEPHGSVALEDSTLVECFTPMRPEYLDEA